MERAKPKNVAAELLLQNAPGEETTVAARVRSVTTKKSEPKDPTKAARTYQVVEYVDREGQLRRVSTFDRGLVEELKNGDRVDLTLIKNSRGFWDLSRVARADDDPTTFIPTNTETAETPKPSKENRSETATSSQPPQTDTRPPAIDSTENKPVERPRPAISPPPYSARNIDPREYRIMSMNALTNAVNFVTSFKELLKPTSVDEAFALVDYYRTMMIDLHDPNYGKSTGESQ